MSNYYRHKHIIAKRTEQVILFGRGACEFTFSIFFSTEQLPVFIIYNMQQLPRATSGRNGTLLHHMLQSLSIERASDINQCCLVSYREISTKRYKNNNALVLIGHGALVEQIRQ
jgi:hypothetical protein